MGARTTIPFMCVIVSYLFCISDGVPYTLFYPYGEDGNDATLEPGDDRSSNEIQLKTPIAFYSELHSSIFVNSNGHLSFETELPVYQPLFVIPIGFKLIAAFLSDIDTRGSGTIYYGETQQTALLQRAAADIQTHFSNFALFHPTSLFIATWDKVGVYEQKTSELNTFQIVIASDGQDSFAFFNYLDGGINFLSGSGKTSAAPDPPAQAGFDSGEGRLHQKLPHSGTLQAKMFSKSSNINVAGVWAYHIGMVENNVDGPDINTGEVTIFDVETEATTCLEGARTCHANANCIDFDEGYCCECVLPYYGNGRQCLKPGAPQRLNGKVYGTLNGETLPRMDMHSYAVTSDGRAYTAISRAEPSIGITLLPLNTIGGIIGWMFAVVATPQAHNGYMFTGGEFNRTAIIRFQSGEIMKVKQQFFGHDALNSLRIETEIKGDVPQVSNVTVDDYKEEYKRVSPGVIKSYSSRTYRVNEIAHKYTWDQTITYKECAADTVEKVSNTMRLSVSRNLVSYDSDNKVIRFAMSNRIRVLTDSDPCIDAAENCDLNADCIPYGNSYRCECRSGFVGDGRICDDIDECDSNLHICDENARCFNVPGSFQCQCLPGFRGDGRICTRTITLCGTVQCDVNALCVYSNDLDQPLCECKPGYTGSGVECFAIEFGCNEVDICHENAECVFDPDDDKYICECVEGFSGDGISCLDYTTDGHCECDVNAECVYDVNQLVFRCLCMVDFTGDGRYCYPITLPDTCTDCDPNSQCMFDQSLQQYKCRCVTGYYGDGHRCELLDCRIHDICHFDAECAPDYSTNTYQCVCKTGYVGDGQRCDLDGCNILQDCDVNAHCGADPRDTSHFICLCNEGFEGDGKLCIQRVVPCNQIDNCSQFAECIYDPNSLSFRCRCGAGYVGDGYTCQTRGEDCQRDPRLCDSHATCVLNVDMFVCVCDLGFHGDGKTCYKIDEEENYLIYAQGYSIQRVPFTQNSNIQPERILSLPGQLAVGVATDCFENLLFWTDAAGGRIGKANLDGTDSETIVSGLSSPEGIAVDWVSKTIYWTDSGLDTIEVAHLNGSSRKSVIKSDLVNPRAVIVDPGRGLMFWTDWNRGSPKIEKAYMDGTNREVFVDTDLGLPNGLTIDYHTQQICWGDAGVQTIECIRSDGVGRIIVTEDASYPFDITFIGNDLYWSDWTISGVPHVNRNDGQRELPLSLSVGGNGKLYGITAVQGHCPQLSNACAHDNGGCRFLCLPTPHGGRTCHCPDDMDPEKCNEVVLLRKRK